MHAGGNLMRGRPIQRWPRGYAVGITATGTSQKTRKRGRLKVEMAGLEAFFREGWTLSSEMTQAEKTWAFFFNEAMIYVTVRSVNHMAELIPSSA